MGTEECGANILANETRLVQAKVVAEAKEYLDEVLERYDQELDGIHLVLETVPGTVPSTLLELSSQEHSDLMVMCSWGCAITTSVVINPDVAGTIIKQAQSVCGDGAPYYDLIALATHGRTGFKRAILGSVTEHIFGATSLPLLVVCPSVTQSEEKHLVTEKKGKTSQSWVGLRAFVKGTKTCVRRRASPPHTGRKCTI